ncbi:Transcriptional regulator, PadR family [Candidatus Sulfopaludibacter sp. SbA3]|nr:Transcriptional regulator, PadR family [Candidatus Sulfopaludibacter sp. SbA3]
MFKKSSSAPDLLPGTLHMLILCTLARGPEHGYGIAAKLKERSEEIVQVGEGSLYPALQGLLVDGLVKSEWKNTGNNRRARYYSITAAGRKHLERESAEFDRMVRAIQRLLQPV